MSAEKSALSTPIVIGNWKMYKGISEAESFVKDLLDQLPNPSITVGLAVPFTLIRPVALQLKSSSVLTGAQNMHEASEGAYTGEIAASMIQDAGASFVILGHSERRRYFHETNQQINLKVKKAISSNLYAVLCIGETWDERQEGKTEDVLRKQILEGLEGVDISPYLLVAYEPLWAIGTGVTALPEAIQSVVAFCQSQFIQLFGESGSAIPLLYGGSVKPENCEELLAIPAVSGLLIGGASLTVDSLAKIIEIASVARKSSE
jgi:triosephosphate isomerase